MIRIKEGEKPAMKENTKCTDVFQLVWLHEPNKLGHDASYDVEHTNSVDKEETIHNAIFLSRSKKADVLIMNSTLSDFPIYKLEYSKVLTSSAEELCQDILDTMNKTSITIVGEDIMIGGEKISTKSSNQEVEDYVRKRLQETIDHHGKDFYKLKTSIPQLETKYRKEGELLFRNASPLKSKSKQDEAE